MTEAITELLRDDYGRIFSILVRRLGDFHLAEDALAEAIASAAATWPRDGTPERPAAWIMTAARNAAISALRRAQTARDKLADVAAAWTPETEDGGDIPDERLRLIFTCCHPALAEEVRVALTLHTLCALSTAAIAALFFVPEPTIAQRIVRAKRKIRASGIPYDIPRDVDERLETVLAVVYLLFTDGYRRYTRALCDEAVRLGKILATLCPGHAEVHGLYALMRLHHARRDARDDGALPVPLDEQDRSRWHHAEIADGCRALDHALARGTPGPYQIQAAIAALHATAPTAEATDWPQIAALYGELWQRQPSPSVGIALAIAEGMAHGAERGLERLAALDAAGALAGSDRIAAARADLAFRAGRLGEAAAAYREAEACAASDRERQFFAARAARCHATGATS